MPRPQPRRPAPGKRFSAKPNSKPRPRSMPTPTEPGDKRPPNKWRGFLRLVNGLKGHRVRNDISRAETAAMISKLCGDWAPTVDDINRCRNHFHAFGEFLTRYTGTPVSETMARMCFTHSIQKGYVFTDYFLDTVLGSRLWPPARADGRRDPAGKENPGRSGANCGTVHLSPWSEIEPLMLRFWGDEDAKADQRLV
eukprot:jgi/Tetstr1/447239/TSEL_034676.t1